MIMPFAVFYSLQIKGPTYAGIVFLTHSATDTYCVHHIELIALSMDRLPLHEIQFGAGGGEQHRRPARSITAKPLPKIIEAMAPKTILEASNHQNTRSCSR